MEKNADVNFALDIPNSRLREVMNYEDFDVFSAFSEFNRTYSDIPENHLFIVMNH